MCGGIPRREFLAQISKMPRKMSEETKRKRAVQLVKAREKQIRENGGLFKSKPPPAPAPVNKWEGKEHYREAVSD